MAVSLDQQIEEIDYEIAMRRKVYPSLAARGKRRKSELDFQIERMEAVKRTLQWLQDNESAIRQRLAY